MTKPAAARIFISYSRKDGAAFAARLRRNLEAKGFGIWQDLIALEGGRDWWSQIEGALKSNALQHFILVVTPQALASHVVRREIRLARQEGKTSCRSRARGSRIGSEISTRCRAGSVSSRISTSSSIGSPCSACWRMRAG
ncbi:MAG: toll/interleukin-1 receptor domain-containing protein [Hyphomicrobiaceae bacterium]